MSDFGSRFAAAAIPKLLLVLGDAVTYTPLSGAPSSINAIFSILDDASEVRRALFVIASDATGIAGPVRGDKVTLGADVWQVVEVRTNNTGSHELLCVLSVLNT